MIIETAKANQVFCANVLDKKKRLELVITPNYVQVVYHNASHKALKGHGKIFFDGIEESIKKAIDSYKSEDIKAMVKAAYDGFLVTNEKSNLTLN